MKSKSSDTGQGRPSATSIPNDLLEAIRTYPSYSRHPFEEKEPSKYKESDLRVVVSLISQKIREHIVRDPENREFEKLIEPKLGDKYDDYRRGDYYEELLDAKTLKRCFVERQASETTQKIFSAFQIVIDAERKAKKAFEQIKERVGGLYYAITTHSTQPGAFQLSLMKIDEDKTTLKHISSKLELETKTMSQEMIGKNNLLLTSKEDGNVLFFYLYIGTVPKPPFIQGVILYTNLYGNVVSNLAVFARIKDMTAKSEQDLFENFIPERGSEKISADIIAPNLVPTSVVVEKDPTLTVLKNIQHFLLQKANPLITKVYNNLLPFDFAKSVAAEPGPYGQDARDYNKAKALTGDYYIYFNERFKSAPGIKEDLLHSSDEFSTIGKGIFKIERDDKTGAMKCTMRTRKDAEGKTFLRHEGFIINTRLGVSPYLLTSLYSGQDDGRCIVLLFKIIDDKKMTGGHVIAYSAQGRLGAGAVVMVRQEVIDGERDKDAPEPEPQALIPHAYETTSVLEKRILNYLSLKNRGLVVPPEEYEALETYGADNPYEGLYRLYEAKDDGQGFVISVLRIYREGFATHLDARGARATGIVSKVDDFLSVTLKNEKSKRTGFLCVKVGSEPTPPTIDKDKGPTIYRGTFAGVSRSSSEDARGPVASQFCLEFCGKTELPDIKPEEHVPFEAAPKEIRKDFATAKITKLSFPKKLPSHRPA